jgi:hypothetical protein
MLIGVNLKIDVTKIDKERLFKGQKGTYLDAIVFVDVDNPDEYGNNGMITQAVSKEEREAGTKGAILGNSKVFLKKGGSSYPEDKPEPEQPPKLTPTMPPMPDEQDEDDIPF